MTEQSKIQNGISSQVSLLDVLLGTGNAWRPRAPEPTILPHVAPFTPESSLSFLCYLADGFARGRFALKIPWPALGGAVFAAVADRLPRLEHPERLQEEYPMLVWFTPQARESDVTQLAAAVERGESWLPLAIDCRHPEAMVQSVADIGRRSGNRFFERFFSLDRPTGSSGRDSPPPVPDLTAR
jgi:hypothetical protein